ncbi:MAG: hypothetical protein LBB72_06370 [Spirochaetaceae bacterium]|nr:hypothetical protein [Spirochaetaceae bacterium]
MLADCYRGRINVLNRINDYHSLRIVKTAILTVGIISNETIRVRNMGTKRDSICKPIQFQKQHIIWAVFFGKDFFTLSEL